MRNGGLRWLRWYEIAMSLVLIVDGCCRKKEASKMECEKTLVLGSASPHVRVVYAKSDNNNEGGLKVFSGKESIACKRRRDSHSPRAEAVGWEEDAVRWC